MNSDFRLFIKEESSNLLGIYAASTVINGIEKKRTEFQDGWNQAIIKRSKNECELEDWANTLTEDQQNAICEINKKENNISVYRMDDDSFYLALSCNDVFSWGCSDAEEITVDDLPEILKFHRETPVYGYIKWCCIKRNQRPQGCFIKYMKNDGVWCEKMDRLPL